jgi:hypothetical protein
MDTCTSQQLDAPGAVKSSKMDIHRDRLTDRAPAPF